MVGDGTQMEQLLNELVKRLQEAYEDDLISVTLYGSAASGDCGS